MILLTSADKKLLKKLLNDYATKKVPNDSKARLRVNKLMDKIETFDEE